MQRCGGRLAVALAAGLVLAATAADGAEREVLVLRGQGSPPAKMPVAAQPPAVRAFAGERLWLIDRDRLVACRLERTTRVGERRIRCAERGLPRVAG